MSSCRQFPDRSRKLGWGLLRRVMANARQDAVLPATSKLACRRCSVGCHDDAVGITVQRDCRYGNCGKGGEAPLQVIVRSVSWRRPEAMTVGVNDDLDIVRIVECRRTPLESGRIELPVW